MSQLTETELVERCRAGQTSAERQLYERYAQAMYNVCVRMMGRVDEAEDALQDAFIMIFKKLHTYRGESTLGAWIKRIVINHCITTLRKRRLQLVELNEQITPPILDTPTDSEPPCRAEDIRKAILDLAPGYRTVITLYLVEGYDHSEIADILGISESTSKTQYHRAKIKLREALMP